MFVTFFVCNGHKRLITASKHDVIIVSSSWQTSVKKKLRQQGYLLTSYFETTFVPRCDSSRGHERTEPRAHATHTHTHAPPQHTTDAPPTSRRADEPPAHRPKLYLFILFFNQLAACFR
jgi:hypothetical protein